tara:strand:+ start:5037 stop:5276 length:240 start_codon:yes stop_codon:yes gene_type:complete
MKKLILLIFISSLFANSPTIDELRENIFVFEKHYDVFFRKFYGCPSEGQLSNDVCKPGRGVVDYVAFDKAGKAAKKLFP